MRTLNSGTWSNTQAFAGVPPATDGRKAARPAWSVIVPTFERPAELARCVEALLALTPPPGGFEVIVVNDGGTKPLALPEDPRLRLVHQRNAGPGTARNLGARQARGTCLAFTDDDCLPEPGWLRALDRALARAPDALIGGRTLNGLEANAYSRASQELVALFESWEQVDGQFRFFPSNNIAMSSACFHAVGGFPTGFPRAAGEDRAFCDGWIAAGLPLRKTEAIVRHLHRLDAQSYWVQHFNYGRGAFALAHRRRQAPRGGRGRSRLDLLRRMAARSVAEPGIVRALRTGWLMALSQIATTSGFVYESAQRTWRRSDYGVSGASGVSRF